jgi:type 1 glutamine amidotransferase
LALLTIPVSAKDLISVLIIDGQNNHKWQETTPVLKELLEQSGLFRVDVATTPPQGSDMSSFKPDFSKYRVVLSNYNGDPWPEATNKAFEEFVRDGGGFVSFHAADNAFRGWKEYNEMIALGGWGDRTEQDGPYVRWRDGKMVIESKPGPSGHHGKRHSFLITTRDTKHPITKGLPLMWLHHTDELYDSLRGPARNMSLLATAMSDPATGGTGEHEPILFTISYGKGRVFHTTLGHDTEAMACKGFIYTLLRGTEWAATGKVTQKVPPDFPKVERVSLRTK